MLTHREDLRFNMDVVGGGGSVRTRRETKGAVLDDLKFMNRGSRVIGEDDLGGVIDNRGE